MEWFKKSYGTDVYESIQYQSLLPENVYEKINSYIKQYEFELLVMLEKERDGIIDTLFHSDLVKKMEFHLSIPLLSFSEQYLRVQDKEGMNVEAKNKSKK